MKLLIRRSEYVKNSLISVVGVALAAVIPIAIQPFLGRIFTPEQVNNLGLYTAITTVLAIAANFRYGYVVAITRNDEDAKSVLFGSILLSFFFAGMIFILQVLVADPLVSFFQLDPSFATWFCFMPLSVFVISVAIGLNGWLIRKKRFTAMATNKSVRRGGEGVAQLILGKLNFAGGMIYGAIIGDVLNFFVHFFQFRRSGGNFHGVDAVTVKRNIRQYIDFPKYNLVPALLDTLSLYLPYLVVNAYYSKEISGQFYESRLVLMLPLVLIATAISTVLLQKLTEKRDLGQKMTPILLRHIYILSVMGIVGVVVVYPFGEELFLIFLGPQWGMAGNMASLMVISYALRFVVAPLSQIFFALEKVKTVSYWQYGYFIGMGCLFFLPGKSINTFISWYVMIEVLAYLIYLVLILAVAKKYDRSLAG